LALVFLPPIMLGWLLIKQRNKIGDELNKFNLKNNTENIFYSTVFAFIGFNVINSWMLRDVEQMASASVSVSIPILYIYSVTFIPIIEEYICRGFIFKKLYSRFGFFISALISSVAFAIPHFNLESFIGYMLIGFVWCWYYKKSSNLIVPIVSHALFNFITIMITSLKG
jgi:hypothetical protein